MLEDLEIVLAVVKTRIGSISLDVPFIPTDALWEEVRSRYTASSADNAKVVGNSLVIKTPNGYFLTIGSQELPRVWAVLPYVRALTPYENKVDELAHLMGFASRAAGRAKEEIFKKLPSNDWEALLKADDVNKINQLIDNDMGFSPVEQGYFRRFLSDKVWSGVSKTLERGDWRMSAIVGAGMWLANASTRRGELADVLSSSVLFENGMAATIAEIEGTAPVPNNNQPAIGAKNVIYYGAPGTGKSHRVDGLINEATTVRTVFHPDTQNSDFFGCLKPQMENGNVTYGFAPGPFANILASAVAQPQNHYYLVIEELNRAPAASVFGELFQLLDRGDDGLGTYEVDFPTLESAAWFNANGYSASKLRLPKNLSIYATMNSADQGVYPLDTAFRRRWEQEYLPLADGVGPRGTVTFVTDQGAKVMEWKDFVGVLNEYLLVNVKPPEDRLFGLWFVKDRELSNGSVPAKILLYLIDDLLRHEDKAVIFANELRTYGEISRAMTNSQVIFSDRFLERLLARLEENQPQAPNIAQNAVAAEAQ